MNKLKLFYWQGINRLQHKQRGTIVAESAVVAQQILLARGLQRIKIQRNWQFATPPKGAEMCDFFVQLAMLLQAAVPLKSCLQMVQQHCVNIALYRWLSAILQDLETGLRFSQSLEKQQNHKQSYLTTQELQLIRVGEMTGNLAEVCQQIADYRQQALALQRKVQKILLYPMLVLAVSMILTCLLLIFIVPQFAEMYGGSQNLPFFTALLLHFSNVLQQYGWHFLLFLLLLSVLFQFRIKHSVRWRARKAALIGYMPLLNRIVDLNRLVSFCRNLHLMLQAGIPLNQALNSFLPNKVAWQQNQLDREEDVMLSKQVRSILTSIGQGYPLYQSVSEPFFPSQAQQMLQVGEVSGKLALMLRHIANNYQQRLDHQIDLLSQMLEPLLMVIIGGLIGLIMLGMYLPIFNMGSLIQ